MGWNFVEMNKHNAIPIESEKRYRFYFVHSYYVIADNQVDVLFQKKYDLIDILNYKALEEKVPFLGICLGMQLMTRGSEEGTLSGLGWFDADTVKFNFDKEKKIPIPHMGWNFVEMNKHNAIPIESEKRYRFYFVHSYYVRADNQGDVLFQTKYGEKFHSALKKENLIGMQFHPEKSLNFGMDIFKLFSKM
jgi:glutamine amidotransferase